MRVSVDDVYRTKTHEHCFCTYGNPQEIIVDGNIGCIFVDVPILTITPLYDVSHEVGVTNWYLINDDIPVMGNESISVDYSRTPQIRKRSTKPFSVIWTGDYGKENEQTYYRL